MHVRAAGWSNLGHVAQVVITLRERQGTRPCLGSWTRILDSWPRILDSGLWTLDSGILDPDSGLWILGSILSQSKRRAIWLPKAILRESERNGPRGPFLDLNKSFLESIKLASYLAP